MRCRACMGCRWRMVPQQEEWLAVAACRVPVVNSLLVGWFMVQVCTALPCRLPDSGHTLLPAARALPGDSGSCKAPMHLPRCKAAVTWHPWCPQIRGVTQGARPAKAHEVIHHPASVFLSVRLHLPSTAVRFDV
jgi:hypothetical protein